LPEAFVEHADFCDAAGAPLYGVLLRALAADWGAGGPTREALAGREASSREDVVQLRLLAGLHRLVLTGQAPELLPFYRNLGGQAPPQGVWPVARRVLADHAAELRSELDGAPQTNEVGRSAALAVGILTACAAHRRRRVRLLEIGASAGLNLLVDSYRVEGEGWAWGPPAARVALRTAVRGVLPAPVRRGWLDGPAAPVVVARRGCDLAPVDPRSDAGRLWLTSFVWPDHVERHARLAAALAAVTALPVDDVPAVDRRAAVPWLEERLAEPVPGDVLTVVWHSVVRQYVAGEEWKQVLDAIDAARSRIPIAHVAMEPARGYTVDPELRVDGRPVATVPAHGLPVALSQE
jgi:hypothetical protein